MMQAKWAVGLGIILTFSFISSQSEGVSFEEIQRLSRLSVVDYRYDFFGDAEIEYILEEAESRPPDGYVEPVDLRTLIDEYEVSREQFVAHNPLPSGQDVHRVTPMGESSFIGSSVSTAQPFVDNATVVLPDGTSVGRNTPNPLTSIHIDSTKDTELPHSGSSGRVLPAPGSYRVLAPSSERPTNRADFVANQPVPSGEGVMRYDPRGPSYGQTFTPPPVTPPTAASSDRANFVANQPVPSGEGVMRYDPRGPSYGQTFTPPTAASSDRANFVANQSVPSGEGVMRYDPRGPSYGQTFTPPPVTPPTAAGSDRANFVANQSVPSGEGVMRYDPRGPSYGQTFTPPLMPVDEPAPVVEPEPLPLVPAPSPIITPPIKTANNPWDHLPVADREFFEPFWNNKLEYTSSYIQVMATHQPLSLRRTIQRFKGVLPLQVVVEQRRLGPLYLLLIGPLQVDEVGAVAALLERQGIRDYFLVVQ